MADKAGSQVGAHDATITSDPPSDTMVVTHPKTGEPLLDSNGNQIIQEHPSVEARQEQDNAQVALKKATEQLKQAQARVEDAQKAVAAADARWDEIVEDLVTRFGGTE